MERYFFMVTWLNGTMLGIDYCRRAVYGYDRDNARANLILNIKKDFPDIDLSQIDIIYTS